MKTYKNLYEKIYSFETLHTAYLKARKNKRYQDEVLRFSANLEENLFDIRQRLKDHTYVTGKYRKFIINDHKKRLIMSLPFDERVIHWAIYYVLNPLFLKQYISDSYGCITGKGAHGAIKRVQDWLKQGYRTNKKLYFLKLDVTKFYYSVDHDILLDIISRTVADKEVLQLLDVIINNTETAFSVAPDMEVPEEILFNKGMPIGNLTSQMFANIYLNELDQYIKRTLGIKKYVRYMDDMIILADSKPQLHEWKRQIEAYLNDKLQLSLNNKTCIRPVTLGIEFVGFRIWDTHIKLRKSTMMRMKRRLKHLRKQYEQGMVELSVITETVTSYQGILKYCNSYSFKKKFFDEYVLQRKMGGIDLHEES